MFKTILAILNFILLFFIFIQLAEKLPIPIEKINPQQKIIREALIYLKAPTNDIPELTTAILSASERINISPLLIVALIDTESNFDKEAISKKNFKGLMQTPTATMQFIDVDILHGARILEEKLKFAKGDLLKALALYKGGLNKKAKNQAKEVYIKYIDLKTKYKTI